MSGLPAKGKFQIVSYVNPNQPVGADIDETSGVKPVITDGATKVWSIQNGQYVLGDKWYAAVNGNQVVPVVKTSMDTGTSVEFRAVQEGVYVIKCYGPDCDWGQFKGSCK